MQTAARFGGFLLFSNEPGNPITEAESFEGYWASQPHVDFGPTYVNTVSLNAEGRGAASAQVRHGLPILVYCSLLSHAYLMFCTTLLF